MTPTAPFRTQDAPNLTTFCEECGATHGEHVCTLAAGHDGAHVVMDTEWVIWEDDDA